MVCAHATHTGRDTSSRNSEVIHAGIHYPRDSLKARLCGASRQALYDFCASHQVSHKRCGKLIVATDPAQVDILRAIRQKAADNGVHDVRLIDRAEVSRLEPELAVLAALVSASTGIVDSHALMLALQGDAETPGAMIAFATPVQGGQVGWQGIVLDAGGSDPGRWRARTVVNCAGLHAQRVAAGLDGFPGAHVPPTFYAKCTYFALSGKAKFSHLIYPLPKAAGLGVHLTLDLQGQALFGPDVEWVPAIGQAPAPPAQTTPLACFERRRRCPN